MKFGHLQIANACIEYAPNTVMIPTGLVYTHILANNLLDYCGNNRTLCLLY